MTPELAALIAFAATALFAYLAVMEEGYFRLLFVFLAGGFGAAGGFMAGTAFFNFLNS